MSFKYFILGFVVETVSSIDDTVSKVPVLLGMTKTRAGKIAFSIGAMIAVVAAIFLAVFSSEYIKEIPHFRWWVGGVIFLLAVLIYFDVFAKKGVKVGVRVLEVKKISTSRVLQLVVVGFIISFVTLIDDTLLFIPLFAGAEYSLIAAASGILLSAFLQVVVMIFFTELLEKLPFKKTIAVGGLLLFGVLIVTGVI